MDTSKKIKICFLSAFLPFLLLFMGMPVFSQQIRHLGIADGLNGRQTFNFGQDKDGFIWISTRFGVDRYDGKKIKNYLFPVLNEVKNPMREVHILFNNDSVLWAYTDNGEIYYYNDQTDNFETFRNLKFYLKTVVFDENNNIWFGTNNSFGTFRNGRTVIISHPELQYQLVRRILKYDHRSLIIISTYSVYIYDIKNNTLKKFFDRDGLEILSGVQIESAYYDTLDKQLWVGTANSGIILYNEKDKSFNRINNTNSAYNPILSIYPPDRDHLFFATDGMGALLLEKKSLKIVQTFRQDADKQFPLSGNAIYDVFKDKEGRIWMSTYSDGVNIIESKKEGFYILRNEKNNKNSLLTNVVTSIIEDSDQNMWFGTNNGVSFWNRAKNQWKHLLISNTILTIIEDSQHKIWIGTYSAGVYVLDKNGNIVHHYQKLPNQTNTIGTNFVYTIFEDSQGNIWIGGIKGPLSKLDRKANTFKHIRIYQINNISKLNNDEIMVATVNGLHILSLKTDQFKVWKHNENLKSKCIFNILAESDSIVWLTAYGGGLSRCNLNNGHIHNYAQKDGLASDISYAVLKDNQNNIWVSSEYGISKLNTKTDSITNFTTGDGISDMSFRPYSGTKTKSGELFFGSYNGVTYFKPNEIVNSPSKSRLIFTDFSLFNRVTHAGEKNSPLKDKINNTSKLELKHRDHSFSLSFTTINFAPNAKRKYMWKLEGLDKDWVGPSSETVVNYTNLTPKTYVFKLQSIGDNNIVLDERELEVIIHPPFWNTIWAKLIGFVLLVLLSYWGYKYLSNVYEKKRTTEKIKFFINTTHDLRTPLTLISSPLYELKEKLVLDQWDKYLLDLVTSNLDKMNKMVSQLLDFQKTYESQEQLIITKNNVNAMLTDKAMYWKPVAERKGIDLQIKLPEKTLYEWYDKEKLDKIFDNLISNAIKYTGKDGMVSVHLTYGINHWQVNVTDNGIGIPKAAIKKLFKRFYRAENAINSQETGSGLGLLLIKSYVNLHKGKIGVNSSENNGSDFFVHFKRGNKHYDTNIMPLDTELPVSKETTLLNHNENIEKHKIKLLIVEDNNDLREYMKLSMNHYYTTYTAENGQDAWDKIPTVNPDIILSDYNMPSMNGFELCEKIKKTYETSHIPVILLTVMTDEKHVEEGYRIGADDYIQKPFDVKYLKIKIDNIINNRKILRSKFLEINRPLETDDTAENDLNIKFLNKATKIVEDHITDTGFSIADFSREMGMSKSLLYTKFNAVTGYTPNDFIKIVRMKKAVTLLKEGRYSINEIAGLTGFDEASYFTTCFKKTYGKSPKQFIKDEIPDEANS